MSPVINASGDFSAINIDENRELTNEAREQMIVRCFQLERLQPTVDQFPGKNLGCNEGVDSLGNKIPLSLRVSYKEPTGGIYSHYRVFIKPDDSEVFNFEMAKNGQELTSLGCHEGYCYVDVPKGTNYYDFINLMPTRRYATAAIPILKEGGAIYYSESNSRTESCKIKVPSVAFNEWTNIISLGPKTDARWEVKYIPSGADSYFVDRHHLPERLNENGIPLEIDTELENIQVVFDGVFNEDQKDWSDQGIIHLEWKDLEFGRRLVDEAKGEYQDLTFFDILNEINPTILNQEKSERVYGYRVLRSSDLGVSWVDLTKTNTDINSTYKQTVTNDGLIYPCYTENETHQQTTMEPCRPKYFHNGKDQYIPRIAKFTDYSVRYAPSNGSEDRARVYLYKVELVFNGITIPLMGEDQIIKVILPPPNMAFAHRKIINRSMCLELSTENDQKEISKGAGQHYSCPYNGLGASGKNIPWSTSATVYDIGGDLLIDRFELGCNWTRGDSSDWSATANMPSDLSSYDGSTTGCVAKSYVDENQNVPLDEYPVGGSASLSESELYDDMRRARKGDCIGSWVTTLGTDKSEDLNNSYAVRSYSYPGAFGGGSFTDTDTHADNGPNSNGHFIQTYFGPSDGSYPVADDFLVRSEFGAVLFNRIGSGSNIVGHIGEITSSNVNYPSEYNSIAAKTANDEKIQVNGRSSRQSRSGCWINLSYVDGNNKQVPRWFSINQILTSKLLDGSEVGDLYAIDGNGNGSALKFGEMTFEELKSSFMYDENNNYLVPESLNNRLYDKLNIVRAMTTNAAKAPPIVNVGQEESDKICEQYNVSLVVQPEDNELNFQNLENANKRLPTRKELIAYSAWPETYDVSAINNIETRVLAAEDRRGETEVTHVGGCNVDGGRVSTLVDSEGNIDAVDRRKISQAKILDGNYITPAMPVRISDNENSPGQAFFGGSSQLDPESEDSLSLESGDLNYNSEYCVSRFGVQDLVGNVMERTADRIFCNFNEREMWFTETDPNSGFDENSAVIAFSNLASDPLSLGNNFSDRRNNSLLNLSTPLTDRGEGLVHRDLLGIKIDATANIYAKVSGVNTKLFCNVAGAGHADDSQITYNQDDYMYNPIVDYFLGVNDRLLLGATFSHFNIEALNDFRNGDGTFLDFGHSSKNKKSQG